MKPLTQGQYTDAVLDKMAMTFFALAKNADFEAAAPAQRTPEGETEEADLTGAEPGADEGIEDGGRRGRPPVELGGLVYNIQIHLPESRDPAVYDALFRSLRTHLLT
jgi:hypothetical protein